MAAPILVTQDKRLSVVRRESPPGGDVDTEKLESIRGYGGHPHLIRLAGSGQRAKFPAFVGRQALESFDMRLPVIAVARSDGFLFALRVSRGDCDQAMGILIRHSLEQDGVNEAEHGRGRADAKPKRDDCHCGEARTAAKLAQPVTRVLEQCLEERADANFPHPFLHLLSPTRLDHGLPPCFFFGHSRSHLFRRQQLDVAANFVIQLALDALPTEKGSYQAR